MEDRDRRGAARHRTYKGGRATDNDGRLVLDCVVRNLSRSGAGLRFGTIAMVPERFSLALADAPAPLPCRMIWHRGTDAGVAFE